MMMIVRGREGHTHTLETQRETDRDTERETHRQTNSKRERKREREREKRGAKVWESLWALLLLLLLLQMILWQWSAVPTIWWGPCLCAERNLHASSLSLSLSLSLSPEAEEHASIWRFAILLYSMRASWAGTHSPSLRASHSTLSPSAVDLRSSASTFFLCSCSCSSSWSTFQLTLHLCSVGERKGSIGNNKQTKCRPLSWESKQRGTEGRGLPYLASMGVECAASSLLQFWQTSRANYR